MLIRPSEVVGHSPRQRGDAGGAKGVPRDRYDRPLIHVPNRCPACLDSARASDHRLVPYTRTTTYVDCIEDKSALARWGQRKVLLGASRAAPMVSAARELDPTSDRRALDRIAEELAAIGGAHEGRERGTRLHGLSEYVDRGEVMPAANEQDTADMAAYAMATCAIKMVHIETLVVCDSLEVGGTPDRIVHYDGPGPGAGLAAMPARTRASRGLEYAPDWISGHLIADLKTGTVERGALKMAMQLAIYSRADFYDHETQTRRPLPPVNQDWGVIIHLPAGAATATLYWINLRIGWQGAQLAKQVRELRSAGDKVLVPFAPAVT